MIKIEAYQITKSFGENSIFSDLSFCIDTPGIWAITGPSGCGKTTLLRAIAGLEQIQQGTLSGYEKQNVSYVFQEPRLLPHATVLQNLLCICPDRTKARFWLSMVSLLENENQLPCELSGGMQSRLSFARAFLSERAIILLDEPFNGLDEKTKAKMIALIKEFSQEKIVLIVSHHKDELAALGAKELLSFSHS